MILHYSFLTVNSNCSIV